MMKEWLIFASEQAITIIDGLALIIIAYGTIEAFFHILGGAVTTQDGQRRREVWLRYARWLVGGLTFQLAADVIETSITTQWESVARLAAIAIIRTFLNYFLDRDLAEVRARLHEAPIDRKDLPGLSRNEAA
jgi:uncharacterized membrane protein